MEPAHADAAAPGCVLATSRRTRGSSEASSAPTAAGPLPAAHGCIMSGAMGPPDATPPRTQGAPARIRAGRQWQTAPHSIPMRPSEGNEARCELRGHAKPAQRALAERDLLPCRGRASIRSREAPTASGRSPRPFSGRVARRPRRARRYRVGIARSDVFRWYSCTAAVHVSNVKRKTRGAPRWRIGAAEVAQQRTGDQGRRSRAESPTRCPRDWVSSTG